MRAVLKTCCGCCYPKSPKSAEEDPLDPTAVGRFDEENPSDATQRQTYRCEVVLPEAVLAEGAEVHGFHLPAWTELLKAEPAKCPSLSKMQKVALREWLPMAEWLRREGVDAEPTIFAGMPDSRNIKQGRVTDCSLMSVLSVLAEYDQRWKTSILKSILPSKVGTTSDAAYGCCLFVNGLARRVVVDDLVPVASSGKLLCAHSATPQELWVLLIEKAVAMIMGGSYAMRGSNPGTDAFHLTGWIPETFPLKNEGCVVTSEAEWMSIFDTAQQGFAKGHCVLCVGTTELADATSNELALRSGYVEAVSPSSGLVAGHAYPVLQCCHIDHHRLLFLKNPWGHTRWKGRFSPDDVAWRESEPQLAAKLGYEVGAVDDGSFWISWEDVLRHFSHFYIAWSPAALQLHELQAHGCWNPWPHFVQSILADDTDLLGFNPQFHLELSEPLPADENIGIWVVLSRHIKSREDYNSHFISVSLHQGRSRICCPNNVLEQGVFSNGECALVKLPSTRCPNRDLVLVVSQHGAKRVFNYTLQVYTQVPARLQELPALVPETYSSGAVRSEWTRRSAGGCSNSVWSFFQNPQWSFTVPKEGLQELILFLECPDVSVNLRLFEGPVARPEHLRAAVSSGAYRRGCCLLRLQDLQGSYVLIVSTFRAGVCSPYRLSWHSSSPVSLAPQPHPFVEGALAHPLKLSVHSLQLGRRVELQVRLMEPGRFSVRLQACYGGQAPHLELSSAHPSRPAPYCVRLRASDADQYFQLSGAAVILHAELQPGESYLLCAQVPQTRGARTGKLYIISDRQVVVDSLMSPRGRRR